MKPLPLSLLVFLVCPLVIAPVVQGEGQYIAGGIGDWGFDNFMDKAWNWVKEKVNGAVAWVCDGIVSIFESIRDFHFSMVNSIANFFGSSQGSIMITLNLIMIMAYILIVFALVRVWILILDIIPII